MEKDLMKLSDQEIRELAPDEIRALIREKERLEKELEIRDNDILSHDRVFDLIVRGSMHLILVMSTTTYRAEFVTSNIEAAIGISVGEATADVRTLGEVFEDIERYNGREEFFYHRVSGERRKYLVYVIHLPYGRSDRVAVVLLCRSGNAWGETGDLEEMMIRQTQDVNRAAAYFLSSMSHDFRVPINSISGFVMLLMKNARNPEKVLEYSHNIGVSCQELLTTVDQILDMSRIESGETVLESEEFGLGLMLEELSSLFKSLAKARNQHFIFSSTGIEHDIVLGDRSRLMEMLRGVLSNAVKYTPEDGRVELTVTGTAEEGSGEVALTFEVRDTGSGMTQEQVDAYFAGQIPADAGRVPGRGTGIWVTRRLVDMMDGTISAYSRPGEGTIVWIRIRLRMVNSGAADFWAQHGVRRMLVVNGNLRESARIRNLMMSAGVETTSISSGYGTVKIIEQAGAMEAGYDVVLLDAELQDMDWRDVAMSIHQMSWIRMPVIFLMSDHEIRDEERRGPGVNHVLPKPFYVSALHRLVEKVCVRQTEDEEWMGGAEHGLAGLRFLAAEDNVLNAEVLKELLEASGAKCEIARNGRAALAMFSNSRPGTYDAILLDIVMPVMDGYAAAAAIRALAREDAKTIPILAMTANTLDSEVQKTFDAGMDAHLTKPLDIRVIEGNVRRLRIGRTE